MEYPDPIWQTNIPASLDLSGSPSLVMGPNDSVYWAVSAKGSFGTVQVAKQAIVIGCHSKDGVLQWILQDPKLYSNVADVQPKLVVGSIGELYVVYTTLGATPGNKNAENVFSLCGGCSTLKGPEDIVVARIDGAQSGIPAVSWVLQNAILNSCARESRPSAVFSTATQQLILTYQTTGATLCSARVGSPNIVLVALTPDGGLAWATQDVILNSRGQNGSPSVTVDLSGNIYLAYTITDAVQGGSFQGVKDVEVVRIHAEGSPICVKRDWILSATYSLSTPLADVDPTILCDTRKGILYVAFCTNGTVTGGTHSAASRDLAIASFTLQGAHVWSYQSPEINEPTYRYASVDNPVMSIDDGGNLYVGCHALTSGGNQMILMFRFTPNSPTTNWRFTCGYQSYRAYVPAGLQSAPRAIVFRTNGAYSPPAISIDSGNLYLGFNTFDSIKAFYLTALRQMYPNEHMTAFEYMTDYVGPCKNCVD